MVYSNFRHMILFIDKYYSSAANYIATGMKKFDLDLVIRKSYQNVHFSHVDLLVINYVSKCFETRAMH